MSKRVQFCRKCGEKFRGEENGYCEKHRCSRCDRRARYLTLLLCRTHYANHKYHTSEEWREKQRERTREYLKANPEKCKELSREWLLKNGDRKRASNRAYWHRKNKDSKEKEYHRERVKQYYIRKML